MQGTVKKILADKNIGFISQEGEEKDAFFSADKLDGIKLDDLKEGDAVTFDTEEGDRGPVAINIKKA